MPYWDFRQFLDTLRRQGELVDVDRPINLVHDVAKALKKSNACEGPAFIFNRNGTEFPLVAGVYSTRRKALLAFEATEDTVFDKVIAGLDRPIAPTRFSGDAPCQEVVLTGDQIDITRFPVPTYSPKDGGPFITPAIVASKDPETGIPDIGYYRFQVLGKDRLGFYAHILHRLGKSVAKAQRMGIPYHGAIIIGCDPILAYTCPIQVSESTNDWEVAGGLRGAPVELTRCKTIDLDVPATSEVVIEFALDHDYRAVEGPLGEFTGYYSPAGERSTVRITAITHRRRPYFQGLLTGKPVTENHIVKQIPFEASFYRTLKNQFPTVTKVAIPASGGTQVHMVIAMQPRFAGEARQVILAAMASTIRPKWVTVVEPDIDVHSSAEVQWATAFRVRPDRDVFVVENFPATQLDPTVDEGVPIASRTSSSVGIDATRPVGAPFSEVSDVPGWREFPMPELDR